MKKGSISIGTSGWSYQHWKEVFYPKGVAVRNWLSYYASEFSCTEINNSFYRLPKIDTVENWVKAVPEGFIFCPKLSRYTTQMKKLLDPEEGLRRFFDVFDHIKDSLGSILVQLPAQLGFYPDRTEHFYQLLHTVYRDHLFALEARHPTWLEDESIALMKKYKIAFVISQSNGKFPYGEFITADHVYVRFHGPGKMYASPYPDEQLKYYAKFFKQLKREGKSVYAFFNNDEHAYAINDAKRLIKMCE